MRGTVLPCLAARCGLLLSHMFNTLHLVRLRCTITMEEHVDVFTGKEDVSGSSRLVNFKDTHINLSVDGVTGNTEDQFQCASHWMNS